MRCEKPLLLTGDFNFHLDNTSSSDTKGFMDILDSADLDQHVSGSTHRKGHILALIITQHDDNLVCDVRILSDAYSDLRVVTSRLNCPRPPLSKVLMVFRSTKQLHSSILTDSIKELFSRHDLSNTADINAIVDVYNSRLKDIYNNLAPVQTTWLNHRPWTPWYDKNLRKAKKNKHKKERKYRKLQLTVDKQIFIQACEVQSAIREMQDNILQKYDRRS